MNDIGTGCRQGSALAGLAGRSKTGLTIGRYLNQFRKTSVNGNTPMDARYIQAIPDALIGD